MARLWSTGFEENSTTIEGATATGTANTIDSTTFRSGSYAYKCNPTGTASFLKYQWSVSNVNANKFFRAYFYISSLPSAEDKILWVDRTQTDGVVGIRLETSGVLRLYNEALATPAQIGSDSSALSTGVWYRLEIDFNNTTAASSVITAYIDGVSFATGTVDTSRHTGQAMFGFGARNNVTATYYYDDIAINDATGSFQTSLPGAGSIIHLRPNAAGDNNAWSIQVGGTAGSTNNYTRVNEVTPDDATSYNSDALSGDIDDFNIDDTPSAIGSSDAINVVAVGMRYSAAVAAAEAAFQVRIKKTSAGTVSAGSILTPNAVTWKTNQVVVPTNNYSLTTYQDPDSSNWTKANLDTTQIGYKITTTNTNAAQVSAIWALVEFVPSGVATLTVSVTDSVTIAESVTKLIISSISVTDSITIAENINPNIVSLVSVSDAISITESSSIIFVSLINVSDSLTISESVTIANTQLGPISVSDSLTISESVTMLMISNISVTDSITISENVLLTLVSSISVSDSLTISEALTMLLISNISVTDSISIAESITITNTQLGGISVSDSITIAESVSLVEISSISVTDSITISEALTITNTQLGGISVTDTLTISESVSMLLLSFISVSDSLTISESITLNVSLGFYSINVSDSVTISENISSVATLAGISVSDSVTISENVSRVMNSRISVSDSISISETITMYADSYLRIKNYQMRSRENQWPFGMDDQTII